MYPLWSVYETTIKGRDNRPQYHQELFICSISSEIAVTIFSISPIYFSNYIEFFLNRKLRELAYPDENDPAIVYAPYIMAPTNTPTIGNYKVDISKMAKGVYYQDTTIDSNSLQKFTMKVDYSKDSNNDEEGKA